MKQEIDLGKALRYKLHMFGVLLSGLANMYCDNKPVYKNISVPSLVLNKKIHSIPYHLCREVVAGGVCRVAKEGSVTNLADLFTKVLPRVKREILIDQFM